MCWVGSRLVLEGSLLNELFVLLRLDSVWGGLKMIFFFGSKKISRAVLGPFPDWWPYFEIPIISCLVRGGDLHPWNFTFWTQSHEAFVQMIFLYQVGDFQVPAVTFQRFEDVQSLNNFSISSPFGRWVSENLYTFFWEGVKFPHQLPTFPREIRPLIRAELRDCGG